MLVTRFSPFTGYTRSMELNISIADIEQLSAGVPSTTALAHLTEDEREFFISGISKEDWTSLRILNEL